MSQYVTYWHAFFFCQMGFFRRHYREIIEAEKNRKDSDESWDWVQKSEWESGVVSDDPVSCCLHHGHVLTLIPSSLPYVEEKNILQIFRSFDTFFVGRNGYLVHQIWLIVEFHMIPTEVAICQLEWRDGRKEMETSTKGYGYCIKTSRS